MLAVMTVTTAGGAAYSIEYRGLDGAGKQLSVLRKGGPDDPPETNKPMAADRWYRVTMLTPLPPEIGTKVAMVLDPDGGTDPIVRYSTTVMSVVGTL
jgi:hypothetical protein